MENRWKRIEDGERGSKIWNILKEEEIVWKGMKENKRELERMKEGERGWERMQENIKELFF